MIILSSSSFNCIIIIIDILIIIIMRNAPDHLNGVVETNVARIAAARENPTESNLLSLKSIESFSSDQYITNFRT